MNSRSSSSSSASRGQSPTGASKQPLMYDEERQGGPPSKAGGSLWTRKYLRLFRVRKSTAWLLAIDTTLVLLLVWILMPLITLLERNEELFGARLTLPLHHAPPVEDMRISDEQRIPRILHQTCKTEEVPEKWKVGQESCTKTYKDFEYKLWTDESAREFIATEYPWFIDTYDGYPFPIIRADAMRYFFLYHYGGIYLDMDTMCNETVPFEQIEAYEAPHHAVFKSTTPTGVSNDFMIATKHHPVFRAAIKQIIWYNELTKVWSKILPYVAIMIAAGPMFITMVTKNYLLQQPEVPGLTVQVINATSLAPYITDLESASWHQGDAKTLMFIGQRPWTWYALGAIGVAIALHLLNRLLLLCWRRLDKSSSNEDNQKEYKLM